MMNIYYLFWLKKETMIVSIYFVFDVDNGFSFNDKIGNHSSLTTNDDAEGNIFPKIASALLNFGNSASYIICLPVRSFELLHRKWKLGIKNCIKLSWFNNLHWRCSYMYHIEKLLRLKTKVSIEVCGFWCSLQMLIKI
jgi:hypothetical protein